jgi:hypothetical protein
LEKIAATIWCGADSGKKNPAVLVDHERQPMLTIVESILSPPRIEERTRAQGRLTSGAVHEEKDIEKCRVCW